MGKDPVKEVMLLLEMIVLYLSKPRDNPSAHFYKPYTYVFITLIGKILHSSHHKSLIEA
jgi:hypothetical protein